MKYLDIVVFEKWVYAAISANVTCFFDMKLILLINKCKYFFSIAIIIQKGNIKITDYVTGYFNEEKC